MTVLIEKNNQNVVQKNGAHCGVGGFKLQRPCALDGLWEVEVEVEVKVEVGGEGGEASATCRIRIAQ
jgi:hypothetical protein